MRSVTSPWMATVMACPIPVQLVAVIMVCACPAAARGAVPITEHGSPKATIVKPPEASVVVDFAAAELQKYVRKISGATLPIRAGQAVASVPAIILRTARLDPPRQGLECDSFTLKSSGDQLFLTGNTDRAVLYAVYAFLESLGAAWLEPGAAGESLPQTPTIVADIDRAFKPAFDLRGMCTYDMGEGRETIDWMGKMRMNLVLHTPPGFEKRGILWMEGTQQGTEHNFALRMGLGPDWHKDPANLQYIAMLNGQRALRNTAAWTVANVEACLSNEAAVKRLLAASLKYLEEHPQVYLFDMRADDIPNNWCECAACSRHTPTDNYVSYVNRLAAEVHRRWPQKKVSLIAYFDSMFPPRDVMPDLSLNNLVLWFAPIERPYRQSVHSAAGVPKTPLEFPRNKAQFPATDSGWEPILLGWRKAFAGPILMLDYYHWSGKASARSGYFYTRPDVIAADLRYYRQLGLSGSIGVEPCPLKLPNGWNQYLKARLLWDPSADVAALERRYDEQLYGRFAGAARKCLATMAGVLNTERDDAGSVRMLRDAAAEFAAAVGPGAETPAVEERLARIDLWAQYVVLRKEYYRCVREKQAADLERAESDLFDFVNSNRTKIARYYNEVDRMLPPAIVPRRKAVKK